LSSTGFIWIDGARPAARAWSACARPISPPSTVTAALFDMFCGLNGAIFSPRRSNARASPATSNDLPTWLPVPWIMMAAGFIRVSPHPAAITSPCGGRPAPLLRDPAAP
jgi:hypothetical protein